MSLFLIERSAVFSIFTAQQIKELIYFPGTKSMFYNT